MPSSWSQQENRALSKALSKYSPWQPVDWTAVSAAVCAAGDGVHRTDKACKSQRDRQRDRQRARRNGDGDGDDVRYDVAAAESDSDPTAEAVVEAIRKSRRRDGKTEFFVKWAGYAEFDNTWEPAANLHDELVADFDAADTEPKLAKTQSSAFAASSSTPAKGAPWSMAQVQAIEEAIAVYPTASLIIWEEVASVVSSDGPPRSARDCQTQQAKHSSLVSDSDGTPICARPPRKKTAGDLEADDVATIAPSGKRRKRLAGAADDDDRPGTGTDTADHARMDSRPSSPSSSRVAKCAGPADITMRRLDNNGDQLYFVTNAVVHDTVEEGWFTREALQGYATQLAAYDALHPDGESLKDEILFEIERIEERQPFDGVVYYCVKWAGYEERTWQIAEDIPTEMLSDFDEAYNSKVDNKGSHPAGKYAPRVAATPPFKTSPAKLPAAATQRPSKQKGIGGWGGSGTGPMGVNRDHVPAMRDTIVSLERGDTLKVANWRLKLPEAHGPGWTAKWIEPEGFKRLPCYELRGRHANVQRTFRELMLPKVMECLKV